MYNIFYILFYLMSDLYVKCQIYSWNKYNIINEVFIYTIEIYTSLWNRYWKISVVYYKKVVNLMQRSLNHVN